MTLPSQINYFSKYQQLQYVDDLSSSALLLPSYFFWTLQNTRIYSETTPILGHSSSLLPIIDVPTLQYRPFHRSSKQLPANVLVLPNN